MFLNIKRNYRILFKEDISSLIKLIMKSIHQRIKSRLDWKGNFQLIELLFYWFSPRSSHKHHSSFVAQSNWKWLTLFFNYIHHLSFPTNVCWYVSLVNWTWLVVNRKKFVNYWWLFIRIHFEEIKIKCKLFFFFWSFIQCSCYHFPWAFFLLQDPVMSSYLG